MLTPHAKPAIDEIFRQALTEGRLTMQREKRHKIQAVGAAEKKTDVKVRPITDCSRLLEDPLNDYIEMETFSLESSDDALLGCITGCYYAVWIQNLLTYTYRCALNTHSCKVFAGISSKTNRCF